MIATCCTLFLKFSSQNRFKLYRLHSNVGTRELFSSTAIPRNERTCTTRGPRPFQFSREKSILSDASDERARPRLAFLLSWTSVKMEWTRHVLENIEPKARVNPAIRTQALDAQIMGKLLSLASPESSPSRITDVYVKMHPMMIKLFRYGEDILMYLKWRAERGCYKELRLFPCPPPHLATRICRYARVRGIKRRNLGKRCQLVLLKQKKRK